MRQHPMSDTFNPTQRGQRAQKGLLLDADDDMFDDRQAFAEGPLPGGAERLDKWLWHARFFKSRSLASKQCHAGKVRVDGTVVWKAHFHIRPGHVLTFAQGDHIRIIRVLSLAERRGPANAARALYEDLQPPTPENAVPHLMFF